MRDEFKKLTPICLILFVIGLLRSFSFGLVVVGAFLLIEHMYSYSRWDIKDILGHENLGLLLIVLGFILSANYISAIVIVVIYLIFSKYKWEVGISPIKYAINKLKTIFNKNE